MTNANGLKINVPVLALTINPTISGITITMYFNTNNKMDINIICPFLAPVLANLRIKSVIFFEIKTQNTGKPNEITIANVTSNMWAAKPTITPTNKLVNDKTALHTPDNI
jgi:hypothetical protein